MKNNPLNITDQNNLEDIRSSKKSKIIHCTDSLWITVAIDILNSKINNDIQEFFKHIKNF